MTDTTAPVRVRIDLNARTHDGLYVPARRSLATGPVQRGDAVTVFEPDDGVMATATVKRLDDDWLHLDVDWDGMHDIPARELDVWRDPQLAERIRDAYAQAEGGETVDRGSFEQYLDDEPTPPETAAGLARLRDAPCVFADPEDGAYEQAMRARKRGSSED